MMRSLSGIGWTVFCLLLVWGTMAAQSEKVQCTVTPVGALHPVQGLLERFEVGPGCAARERGDKETHVIAVGRVTNSPNNKVTVLLKPLSLSPSPLRALHLLLSSKLPVSWLLEAERLSPDLLVMVQVSSNCSVESHTLRLQVQPVHSLPFRPRMLHRWALKHHGNLSSLTHTMHGNRVYVRLGEDPTLPAVCQLQSMFISNNYMTSDLQPQEVQGCTHVAAGGNSPEVHVIKLHSAGSGLCGSLQVEVIVSLVPPMASWKMRNKVVLILSSSGPVNWAIIAHGVRGHISVHSSNSVSPPYPPEPDLTLSSTLNSDLSTIPDLLVWASESGYTKVTSYTEADLANRFVIQLAGGGTDVDTVMNTLVVKPNWAEERRLRKWLNGGGRAGGGRESFTVQCEDGRLSMTVDQHILQSLSVPVAAVTLRDPTCQAQSNGSHFLLVFPVISCGTEGLLLGHPKGVQYKNKMILWRDKPRPIPPLNGTEKKFRSPLGIQEISFSCLAASPHSPASDDDDDDDNDDDGDDKDDDDDDDDDHDDDENVNTAQTGLVPWPPEVPGPNPGLSHPQIPRHRPGPLLILKLFVTKNYDQRRIGPCVITADHPVYIEISAKGPFMNFVEVKSCVVSPLSDPKKSPFWTVISDGCSSEPSLTLGLQIKEREEEEEEDTERDDNLEEREEAREGNERRYKETDDGKGGRVSFRHKMGRRGQEMLARTEKSGKNTGAKEEMQSLRFSFILRPVYNDSMQFLHCSLRLCVSDSTRGEPMKEAVENDCKGRLRIPPLVSGSLTHQCEIRNLSRPMVVTQHISSLAPKLSRPPTSQRTKRLSVSPLASPGPEYSSSVVQTGPVMGIVFAAFVMGVSLMGGLWCIYNYTGARPASLGGEGHNLTHQTRGDHSVRNSASPSDQSTSLV